MFPLVLLWAVYHLPGWIWLPIGAIAVIAVFR